MLKKTLTRLKYGVMRRFWTLLVNGANTIEKILIQGAKRLILLPGLCSHNSKPGQLDKLFLESWFFFFFFLSILFT